MSDPEFLSQLHSLLQSSHRSTLPDPESLIAHPKEYPRFPRISLPETTPPSNTLFDSFTRRSSAKFPQEGSLTLDEISTLCSAVRTQPRSGTKRRTYPSGGGLLPIEFYILAFNVSTLERKAYHYNAVLHALEELWPLSDTASREIFRQTTDTDSDFCAAHLILTARWRQSSAKYDNFAYILSLLEAGHAAQNILLAGAALSLAVRPLALFNFSYVSELLDLNPRLEQPSYSIAISSLPKGREI